MKRTLMRSFGHAFRGIQVAWADGRNFRIQLIGLVLVAGTAWYFRLSFGEAALLIGAGLLVLFAEMINTAIERTLDLVETNHHPGVGKIKDMAAGAVLIVSLGAALAATAVLLRHFHVF